MACHWREHYFRYLRQGDVGQQWVKSLLKENSMIPANNNLCLLHMARYIYQAFHHMTSFVGIDQEERILEIIRGHRLYEQTRACMPNSMTQTDNPWSSLALMLVLSDGVEELWELVVTLQHCLTPEQLSEFLWCSATLLRAMADAEVTFSNRFHHNVFSVSHRMENIPGSTRSEADQESEIQMTPEQQRILSHNIQPEHVVKVIAFAGTGKTTTLVSYVKQRPQLRFLYVVFNKAPQLQAESIFPPSVSCRTMHSLAYGAVGQRYHNIYKLARSSLNPLSVFLVMPEGERSFVGAQMVVDTISNFWASTDPNINAQHLPAHLDKTQKQTLLKRAKHIWKKMKKEEPTPELAYKMYHDGYVKLWQLEGAQMAERYDVILIDEASDFTPVMMEILLSQPCAKILVGDPHQQIYSFRRAVDNMASVEHTHLYNLTKSFRFGPEIAYVAATILEVCKKEKITLVGGNQRDFIQGQDSEMWDRFLKGVGGADGKLAVLSRTNASVLQEAARLTDLNPNSRIHIIGGLEALGLHKIQDIWNLKYAGPNPMIQDYCIRQISEKKGYQGLCEYAEGTKDSDLLWKIAVVEKYGERTPELITQISKHEAADKQNADFILSTVHKVKGLEFDTVVITDDFIEVNLQGDQSSVEDDEWNVLYMAVTRAKRNLFMNRAIKGILACAGEHFLRSVVTTMFAESDAPQCSFPGCTNRITNPCRMHRLPITYVTGVERGGAVCLSCVDKMAAHFVFLMSP